MSLVALEPCTGEDFEAFLAATLPRYARERAEGDGIPLAEAEAFARRQRAELLAQGPETPGHRVWRIVERASGQGVGWLWLFVDAARGEAFVYDVTVLPAHRRRGLASAALREAFAQARALGAVRIGLNVFAANAPARALYARLGFREASLYLNRRLDDDERPAP